MTLEDRLPFREALLEHRTESEWEHYRPHHLSFYHSTFDLEGREVKGGDLISEYVARFPADREYSDKGNLNRMLADCDVPQFSFTNQEVIRGFLLSLRSPAEWSKYQPSYHTFQKLDFRHAGIDLKGQMLLYNVFVEQENQREGTFYAFVDYQRDRELYKKIQTTRNGAFIKTLFDIAGLTVKGKSITDEDLTPERLREILLTKRKEDEWKRWEGNSSDFEHTWFDLEGYRNFTGGALRRHYEGLRGSKYSAKDIFSEADIEVGSDPTMLRKRMEDRFERLYGVLEDPQAVRDLFFQVQSEEEWNQPQKFTELRGKKVRVNGNRTMTLHGLLHLFSAYKHNAQQDSVDSYVGYDAQSDPQYKGLFKSNKTELGELLEFAGIDARFIPDVSDVDLHDPALLRRMLFHGKTGDGDLTVGDLTSTPSWKLRKAVFTDPSTGLELKGHSLMLYYTALHYVKEHPEVGLEKATNELNKGKSNQAVWNEILQCAGF
jgi:hypothetical protein